MAVAGAEIMDKGGAGEPKINNFGSAILRTRRYSCSTVHEEKPQISRLALGRHERYQSCGANDSPIFKPESAYEKIIISNNIVIKNILQNFPEHCKFFGAFFLKQLRLF